MKDGQILETQTKQVWQEDGYNEIRVYFRKGKPGGMAPVHTLKCGCCQEKLEIFLGNNGLEIGGVQASIESWRKVLLPLLEIKETQTGFEDTNPLLKLQKKYDPSCEKR